MKTTAPIIIWVVLILFLAGLALYNIFHDYNKDEYEKKNCK